METLTSQSTSRDWLSGNENINFSAWHFLEALTLGSSGVRPANLAFLDMDSDFYLTLPTKDQMSEATDLFREFRLWDNLSDEAILKFEDSL